MASVYTICPSENQQEVHWTRNVCMFQKQASKYVLENSIPENLEKGLRKISVMKSSVIKRLGNRYYFLSFLKMFLKYLKLLQKQQMSQLFQIKEIPRIIIMVVKLIFQFKNSILHKRSFKSVFPVEAAIGSCFQISLRNTLKGVHFVACLID